MIQMFFWCYLQCHDEYAAAYAAHLAQRSAASAAHVLEAHNTYVQQLRAANGMIDHYYRETLPQLLQVRLMRRY